MTDPVSGPPWWRQPLFSLCGGLLVAFSMPPWGWWPLAFAGVGLFGWAVGDKPSRRRSALAGFAFGVGWMYPAMAWMWFLTVPGYLVAAAWFAVYHAVAAAIAPRGRWAPVGRAAAHTLAEALRFVVPFGGIPLASLGIAQADGPFLGLAPVGGVLLLTWFVFQIGFALPSLVAIGSNTVRQRHEYVDPIGLAAAGVALTIALVAVAAPTGSDRDDVEPITVAAVQGGGEQGTTALDVPSALVTERHLEATRTSQPSDDLDLVVWPENGIDVNNEPFVGSDEYELVAAEAARLGVPLSVGVTIDSEFSEHPVDDSFVNAQVVVMPDGEVTGWYEKVHIVPFGEYVPLRGMLEALGAPLENVASDATEGQGPALLPVPYDGSEIDIGVMISWEVFFGDRGRAADDGAFLIIPTNGASYTWTILQTQQVASSRLRAAETGRWVVQVSPTGFSAFVAPNGDVFDRTDVGERAVITRAVPLRQGTTWYSTTGDWPGRLLPLLVLLGSIVLTNRDRRTVRASGPPGD
ncbi:MAG: apolipoprotein N-acyltransferase [Ilumatobacteraceae bacterium]